MMSKHRVKFYKGEYRERQRMANMDKAVCYVEHHFNGGNPNADYSCVIIGSNASKKSAEFGRDYVKLVVEQFGTKVGGSKGLLPGGYGGRGNVNVYYTNCPALLLEPLFCVNPKHAAIIKTEEGIRKLAHCLVQAITLHFPEGGLVAFSVGHKYKLSKPRDRGAPVYGGGTEADYAERVLMLAAKMLTESAADIKIEREPVPILADDDDEPISKPDALVNPANSNSPGQQVASVVPPKPASQAPASNQLPPVESVTTSGYIALPQFAQTQTAGEAQNLKPSTMTMGIVMFNILIAIVAISMAIVTKEWYWHPLSVIASGITAFIYNEGKHRAQKREGV